MVTTDEILGKGGLSKVSPSTWLSLRQCAWQVLLARYFQNKSLLPTHPNAVLGSILHLALEKTSKGELKTREEFDHWWAEAVKKAEQDLQDKGWGQFMPLKENTTHFGLKKVQARNRIMALLPNYSGDPGAVTKLTEKPLSTADGLLSGKLDAILWRDGQSEIRDYKTGMITVSDENDEANPVKIKAEYELQMKLYACIFQENYGDYPARLVLEDLNGGEYDVPFSPEECSRILEEVKLFLAKTNRKISDGDWQGLASPGEHCNQCNFRPACKTYTNLLESMPSLPDKHRIDLSGILESCVDSDFSGLVLQIRRLRDVCTVVGFNSERQEEVKSLIHQKVGVFNLKPATSQKFTCTKFTDIHAI